MPNPYQMKQTDFNATTGKSIASGLKQATIYLLEGIKGAAALLKHLLSTFVGK
jgi:hypothetical protein